MTRAAGVCGRLSKGTGHFVLFKRTDHGYSSESRL